MAVDLIRQPALITGLYRCDNCARDVDAVVKERRFRLCPDCWTEIVEPIAPGKSGDLTEAEYRARDAYWKWYYEMERLRPTTQNYKKGTAPALAYSAEDLYPYCECGRQRRVMMLGTPGLFGGPFGQYCEACEARREVESIFRMAPAIWPGRDEEDILDLLQRANPKAFELGVLPDYWFELRLRQIEVPK